MKWAQTTEMLVIDEVVISERKSLFKEYKTRKALDIDLADPKKFEKWVIYGDDPLQKPFALNRRAQRRYEVFCGGFLYYHDVEFKKYPQGKGYTIDEKGNPKWKEYPTKDFEHTLYFDWFPKAKGKAKASLKTKVIIYISPTPEKFNANPPKPPGPPPPES